MNWVDLVIILALGTALFTGFRRGVVLQLFSWGGFAAGILLGAIVAPPLVRLIDPGSRTTRAVVTMALFLGTAFVLEGIIAFAGFRLARRIKHQKVQLADSVLGSVVAGVLALLLAWFVSVPAKGVPELARSVKRSSILRATYAVLHTPPDLLSGITGLLGRTGFPEVFAQLNPSLAPGVEAPPASLRRDPEIRAASRLTYKIDGEGCSGRVNGSGFPLGRNTVITAAHVVAGTSRTRVIQAEDAGSAIFSATVVYMDTDTDIAVLHVPDLIGGRMRLSTEVAERGTDGAAIGYPGGGDRRTSEARVRIRTKALGRNIYGSGEVERDIYVLRAEVHPGNSGGPFVDTDGRVRGMVFAAAAGDPEESYALAETEVEEALDNAADRRRQVDTGRCAI